MKMILVWKTALVIEWLAILLTTTVFVCLASLSQTAQVYTCIDLCMSRMMHIESIMYTYNFIMPVMVSHNEMIVKLINFRLLSGFS